MSFPVVVSADNNVCFPKFLLDSLTLEAGLFGSSPLTSPEHSLPSSAASSPLSMPPDSPLPTLPPPSTANDDVPPMSMPPALPASLSPSTANDNVPLMSMPTALSNPVANSTHSKCQSHANRRLRRQQQRAAAKLEQQQWVASYKPRRSTAKKHIKSTNTYRTCFNTEGIPIASSGYVAIPGDKSSTAFPLGVLVGPQSRFKMRKVTWNGE